jgi:integrase
MAGKVRYLLERSGRYYARLVVPKHLRETLGKAELRTPLGPDRRQAMKDLSGAVAQLQHQITQAEHRGADTHTIKPGTRYALTPEQIAVTHYRERIRFDDELRNDPRWANTCLDDSYIARLRDAVAGLASSEELIALVGPELTRFGKIGYFDALPGTAEWRVFARHVCIAELEALGRVAERDEGDFTGTPSHPLIRDALEAPAERTPVSLTGLWEDYVNTRIQAGFMKDRGKRQKPVIENLRKYLKHNDAQRIAKKDLLGWRDLLMQTLSAKTVSDMYLSTVRSLLFWAVQNDRLSENVADGVRQPKGRKVVSREPGYTDDEAEKVLKASRAYQPKPDVNGRLREGTSMINVKQWVPLLCAFTGARVAEVVQLRKEDVRKESGYWVVRITPDAGTVKTRTYRDVPLHQQVIAEGFIKFVEASAPGPLFHNSTDPAGYRQASQIAANRLASWLRQTGLTPEGLQPNHAWRHRLKTICNEAAISDRVVDAIQGHAGRTAGDRYGSVTLKTKVDALARLPFYKLS